jgi:hypothetical protein
VFVCLLIHFFLGVQPHLEAAFLIAPGLVASLEAISAMGIPEYQSLRPRWILHWWARLMFSAPRERPRQV